MTGAFVVIAALLMAQGDPGRAAAARRELADVAARIEGMKAAGVRGGPEIERLLAQSQALAAEVDRLERGEESGVSGHGPDGARPGAAADPKELRERADALRDEVDRLSSTLSAIDDRLREEGRRRRAGRLAALEDEGALFAEASPGRVGAPQPRGATGAGGPAGPLGPSGADSGAPPPGPATGGPTVPFTPPPVAPPAAEPAGTPGGAVAGGSLWPPSADYRAWGDRWAPGRQDGEPELRRKREAIAGAIAEARRRIDLIEAEARELDARP